MPFYLVKISYDGREYHGVVPQPNVKTVIGEILEFFEIKNYNLIVTSRTDKGVSAEENYFVLKTDKEINWKEFNHEKIKILAVYRLKEFINIRKFSTGKIYWYYLPKNLENWEKYIYKPKYIIFNEHKLEIKWKDEPFDINLFIQGGKKLIGKHDFSNFCKGRVKNGVCTIYSFDVEEKDEYWIVKIHGKRFLYEMIRKIISFLLAVGKKRFPINYIDIVLSRGKLEPKPPSAPGENLVLKKVFLDWVKLQKYIKERII